MSDNKRIYVGSGKTITGQYGTFRSVSLNLSRIPKEHISEYNGEKYVRLDINDKAEEDQYGKNVSITVNTYQPNQSSAPQPKVQEEEYDMPF